MTLIPWRLKNFVSEHFPLLYHLLRNAGAPANSAEHWDAALERSWDDPIRSWPGKNALIASLVRADAAILDVGCGNGSTLRHLQGLGYTDLHGLEISPYAIRRLDGDHNGAFTEKLLQVWNRGAFDGSYTGLHARIRAALPASQSPNLFTLGPAAVFVAQKPFTV